MADKKITEFQRGCDLTFKSIIISVIKMVGLREFNRLLDEIYIEERKYKDCADSIFYGEK